MAATRQEKTRLIAESLMASFQAGDLKVRELFDAENGVVVQRYSQLGASKSKDEPPSTAISFKNFEVSIQKLTKLVGDPVYEDRTLMVSDDGTRFVQQMVCLQPWTRPKGSLSV
jgi:hypothetical protein